MARYTLRGDQFWKLVAKQRQLDLLRQSLAMVEADSRQIWEAVATEHGFDPKKNYHFNEATEEIVEVEGVPFIS